MRCIPEVNGTYVARMEDMLDLYAEAPVPGRPVVCFDESPTQLIGGFRRAVSVRAIQNGRYSSVTSALSQGSRYRR
jgi:hypothetical protein